jgi:hypothetical protein
MLLKMRIFASHQNLLPRLYLADCECLGNQAGLKSLERLPGSRTRGLCYPDTRGPRR